MGAKGLGFWAISLGLALASVTQAHAYSESEMRAQETPDESKIRELRDEEITQLRIALGRRLASNRRADLYFRLAEIYIEAYRSEYLLEGRVHDKKIERGEKPGRIDHSHSKPYLNAGIKACNEIIGFKIPFAKLDQVYYFLAFNHAELGDRALGMKYFEHLTRHYPKSPFTAEAYRELGNAAFDQGNYRKAMGYYLQGERNARPESQPQIYHRLAWCYYRTKQFDLAVSTMKRAVTATQANSEKFLSLRDEALRDMALFMTETGKVDEAIQYFSEVVDDKQYYPKLLERLGKEYERNVEPEKATKVYESLLKTNPDSEAAFRVLVKLVDLDLRRGRYSGALQRVQNASIPSGGEADTVVAAQNLRAMVRRTATEHHEKFRRTNEKPLLPVAESYYTTYLEKFLSQDDPRKETPEIQMYLAEVKRELGQDREASLLYRKVLDSKDKRYAKEAGALWTASLSESLRKVSAQNKGPNKAQEPSTLEVEFIEAADKLQEALGETNEGREAALRAAQVEAGYKDTRKSAIKRIKAIIEKWPRSSQALTAAQLWIQLEADSKDTDDLMDLCGDLKKNDALMAADQEAGGKLKLVIQEHETRLRIGAIDREEKNSDFEAAGKNYESFANDTPARDLAEKAYANAVNSYVKAGDAEGIERTSAQWIKRFPKSPKAVESLRGAATQALIGGEFAVTARVFEKLGRESGDADSLETAARIYDGSGDPMRAQAARTAYLELYPKNSHAPRVTLDLARSLDNMRMDERAITTYRACMNGAAEYAAECGARLGDMYLRLQDSTRAKATFREVSASRGTAAAREKKKKSAAPAKSGSTKNSPWVGYARYRLAQMTELEARFETMELPEEKLKRGLNQRLQFLEPLSRAYMSAVEAGGPWAVAALDRLAAWAMNFASEVDNIAPPPGVEGEAVVRFQKSLQQVSTPLRKRAAATWMDAYSKALAAESLSPAVPEMSDRLADARMSSPSRAQGFRGRLRLAGVPADGGADGKAVAFKKVRERLNKPTQDPQAWVDYGNLLWGEGKPGLARVAYERSLALAARNPAALNNRGVVVLSSEGQENWLNAAEANQLFQDALKQESLYLAAKINRAALLNYYRLFQKAKPLWEQILVKVVSTEAELDAQDGLAIAHQGLGHNGAAEAGFKKASDLGANKARFSALYHDAARVSSGGAGGAAKCLDRLQGIDESTVSGFERAAVDRLRKTCTEWRGERK